MPTFCSCLVSASAVANVASTAPVLPLSSDRPPDKTPTVGATPSVLRSPAVFITRRARSSIDTPSSIPTGSKKNCRASEVESKAERHIWLAPVCCLSSCRVFRSLIVPRTAASIVPSTSISMSLRSGSDVTTTSCSASSICQRTQDQKSVLLQLLRAIRRGCTLPHLCLLGSSIAQRVVYTPLVYLVPS